MHLILVGILVFRHPPYDTQWCCFVQQQTACTLAVPSCQRAAHDCLPTPNPSSATGGFLHGQLAGWFSLYFFTSLLWCQTDTGSIPAASPHSRSGSSSLCMPPTLMCCLLGQGVRKCVLPWTGRGVMCYMNTIPVHFGIVAAAAATLKPSVLRNGGGSCWAGGICWFTNTPSDKAYLSHWNVEGNNK